MTVRSLVWDRRTALGCLIGSVAFAVLTRIPSAREPFHDDDWVYLDQIQSKGLIGIFPGRSNNFLLYRPVVAAWFAGLRLIGLHPVLWHVLAAALLGVSGWMLGLLSLRLGLSRLQATVGAAFFLFHPAWDVPIAWTSAVSSILCDLAALCCLYVFFGHTRRRIPSAAAILAVALLCKENAVVVPVGAAALALALRRPVRSVLRDCAPLLGVAVVYLAVLRPVFIQRSVPPIYHVSPGLHVVRNVGALLPFLSWLPLRWHIPESRLAALVLCLIAGALALRPGHTRVLERRLAVAGMGFLFVALLPVTFLDQQVMAAYYVDLALIGAALVLASILPRAVAFPRTAAIAAACGVAAVTTGVYSAANPDVQRTKEILRGALPITHAGPITVLHMTSPHDPYISDFGGYLRVIDHDPQLRVAVTGVGLDPAECHLPWVSCR